MSQDPYKNDKNNLPRFGGNRPKDEDPNQPPRKGPRFSIYWIYAIIFAVLIGFQLLNPFSPNTAQIDQDFFMQALKSGDVDKYVVVTNRNTVKVFLKPEALKLPKYTDVLKKNIAGKINEEGPHMTFEIVSGDSFKDDMRKFYSENTEIKDVGKVAKESDWFSKSLSFLLPILLF